VSFSIWVVLPNNAADSPAAKPIYPVAKGRTIDIYIIKRISLQIAQLQQQQKCYILLVPRLVIDRRSRLFG